MIHSTTALFTSMLVVLALQAPTSVADETKQASEKRFSPYVDAQGQITHPQNFRENWSHLGTWLVKDNEHAAGPGVHDVYAEPEAVKAFKKDGQWPDGATLVKEISGIKSKRLTTGDAQWAGDVGVWFVMVRDRHKRFPDNKIWGEGWGWALYKADDPAKNVNTNWKEGGLSNCHGCHTPASNTEWVFIEGYPTVREAARY